MNNVLILGGYGNFGRRIATALAKDNISIIIAGRELKKAEILQRELTKQYPHTIIQVSAFDANKDLNKQLEMLKPKLVINTIGPFQTADYSIAKICIQHHIHYIDLADARTFVTNISSLDSQAKEKNVLVISGASTVPCLSSAVLEYYKNNFKTIDSLIYGITPGQKTPRGLATAESILTYLGKPLKPWGAHNQQKRYGWQDVYRQEYPELGKRWMANCDIPDLDLFPNRYGLKEIRFSGGMENSFLHLGMWFMSYLVRIGLPMNLSKHAKFLLSLSRLFNLIGTTCGGMHMIMTGINKEGKPISIKWFIVAKDEGPQIPCIPAIILSKKIIRGELTTSGALACVAMLTLDEYMKELEGLPIKLYYNVVE